MPATASATAANSSFIAAYDHSGRASSLLRSEPAQTIASIPDQGSTTAENYKDKVTLSADGIDKSRQASTQKAEDPTESASPESDSAEQTDQQQSASLELTPAEEKLVRQLKERDQEVKTHEMAHLASAGQYARGGPTYSYQQGPDGRRYAIGGEVPIDVSKEKTPEETLQKMQAVKRAAMAPAEPSSTDRSVAAAASAMESQARQELQAEQTSRTQEDATEGDETESAEPADNGESLDVAKTANAETRRNAPIDVLA
jgi:hypothetical protein